MRASCPKLLFCRHDGNTHPHFFPLPICSGCLAFLDVPGLKDAAPFFSALGSNNKFLLANSVGQILTDTLSIHTMTLWFMIMGQECIFDKQRNPGQERRTILTILATYSAWLCILFKRGKESERKRVKFNRTASRPPSIHPAQARRAVCRSAELRLFSRLSGATF